MIKMIMVSWMRVTVLTLLVSITDAELPHRFVVLPPYIPIHTQTLFRHELRPNLGDSSFNERSPPFGVSAALRAGVGFADTSYSVDVSENSPGNTLVKTLVLTNKPSLDFPLQCKIDGGNEKGHFIMVENSNRDCELRTRGQQLDFETQKHYVLTVTLRTLISIVDPSRSIATVSINVKDVNDNRPNFVFETNRLTEGIFYAAVARDAPAQTFICRISAEDRDSENNGRISYNISSSSVPGYFAIDHVTGIVNNVRTFEDIRSEQLPFRLTLVARDRPGSITGYLFSLAPLVINLLDDRTRLILVLINILPERVAELKAKFIDFLQERTGMIIGIEKIEGRRMMANSTVTDPGGSDVTFYAIDPRTHRLLPADDSRMRSLFLENDGQYSLLFGLSTALGISGTTIRQPLFSTSGILLAAKTVDDIDVFQAALLALACIIAVLGIVGIVYMCFIWSRYTAYRLQLQQLLVSPHFEPVLVEPSLKEYETQVLQMTVNDSDTEYRRNLETASYSTKDIGANSTLVLDDSLSYSSSTSAASEGREDIRQTYGSRDELECYEVQTRTTVNGGRVERQKRRWNPRPTSLNFDTKEALKEDSAQNSCC